MALKKNGHAIVRRMDDFKSTYEFSDEIKAWEEVGIKVEGKSKDWFTVFGVITEAFIENVLYLIDFKMRNAKNSGNWRDVLNPKLFEHFIKSADDKFHTYFYAQYGPRLNDLVEDYDKSIGKCQPPESPKSNSTHGIIGVLEIQDMQTNVVQDETTAVSESVMDQARGFLLQSLIQPGVKGVSNKQMIPVLKGLVQQEERFKILILKEAYPEVFQMSLRYLNRKQQDYIKSCLQ